MKESVQFIEAKADQSISFKSSMYVDQTTQRVLNESQCHGMCMGTCLYVCVSLANVFGFVFALPFL